MAGTCIGCGFPTRLVVTAEKPFYNMLAPVSHYVKCAYCKVTTCMPYQSEAGATADWKRQYEKS